MVVIGLGADGAVLAGQKISSTRVPAVTTRAVVNTGGAGDALFAAFVHGYVAQHDPLTALRHAVVFAGHKVGAGGSSQGFLDREQLEQTAAQIYAPKR